MQFLYLLTVRNLLQRIIDETRQLLVRLVGDKNRYKMLLEGLIIQVLSKSLRRILLLLLKIVSAQRALLTYNAYNAYNAYLLTIRNYIAVSCASSM